MVTDLLVLLLGHDGVDSRGRVWLRSVCRGVGGVGGVVEGDGDVDGSLSAGGILTRRL